MWPPAYGATAEKRSESTSTILPLPSSPHWAPSTIAVFARICICTPTLNLCLLAHVAPGGRRSEMTWSGAYRRVSDEDRISGPNSYDIRGETANQKTARCQCGKTE